MLEFLKELLGLHQHTNSKVWFFFLEGWEVFPQLQINHVSFICVTSVHNSLCFLFSFHNDRCVLFSGVIKESFLNCTKLGFLLGICILYQLLAIMRGFFKRLSYYCASALPTFVFLCYHLYLWFLLQFTVLKQCQQRVYQTKEAEKWNKVQKKKMSYSFYFSRLATKIEFKPFDWCTWVDGQLGVQAKSYIMSRKS